MIEAISARVSSYIYEHNDRKHVSQEIMEFALRAFLINATSIVLSLIIGWVTGKLIETLVSLVGIIAIRNLAGGYHFASSTACVVVSTFVIVALPYVPLNQLFFYILLVASVGLILVYAPSRMRNATRIGKRGLTIMKLIAMLVVVSNLWIHSDILSVAFFASSVTLISTKGGEINE